MLYLFQKKNINSIPQLWDMCSTQCEPLAKILRAEMDENQIEDVFTALNRLPKLSLNVSLALGEDKPILKLPYEGKFFLMSKEHRTSIFLSIVRQRWSLSPKFLQKSSTFSDFT